MARRQVAGFESEATGWGLPVPSPLTRCCSTAAVVFGPIGAPLTGERQVSVRTQPCVPSAAHRPTTTSVSPRCATKRIRL